MGPGDVSRPLAEGGPGGPPPRRGRAWGAGAPLPWPVGLPFGRGGILNARRAVREEEITELPLNRPQLGYKRRGRPPPSHTLHIHTLIHTFNHHILILSSPLHNVEPLHHTSTLQEYYGESRATLPSLARIVVRSERGARAEFLLRRTPGKLGFHGAECRTCRLPPHLYLYSVVLFGVKTLCFSLGKNLSKFFLVIIFLCVRRSF